MSHRLVWLDDERDPADPRWQEYFPVAPAEVTWLTCFSQFVLWIEQNGLPDSICFDHDLGEGPSGYDAAKWLTEYCLDHQLRLPKWNIQSANPIGKENIRSLLESFERMV